jgi:cell division protein FtsZ
VKPQQIRIVGVGGAGVRFVERLASTTEQWPSVIAVDTDADALDASCASVKLRIGEERLRGSGAGGDASVGRDAAQDDREMLRNVVAGAELVIAVAGLGGGTGSGALPVVLQIARDENVPSLCFVTFPFAFEGHERKSQADRTFATLRELCGGAVVVPNDRLIDSVGTEPVHEAFDRSARILGNGIRALWTLLVRPGHVPLGLADLMAMLRQCGRVCAFGYGEGAGPDRAALAAKNLLGGPLLGHGRLLATARYALISVSGGSDLRVAEVRTVLDAITGAVGSETRLSVGAVTAEDWGDSIAVTVLLSDQWLIEAAGATVPGEAACAQEARSEKTPERVRPAGSEMKQVSLDFEPVGNKGRFRNVEPTMQDGEDLDIPTFVRRRLSVDR